MAKRKPKSKSKSKGLFPLEKGPTPSKMEPKQITGIYKIGAGCQFRTEEDVIKFFKYKLEEKLGEGGFGVVYMAVDLTKNTKNACKMCQLGNNMKDSRIMDMKNELFIMEKVKHLYIVKLMKHFMTLSPSGNRLYLFMELADGGDFSKLINKSGPFTENQAKLYFAQIICGINHMHSLGIAHRDIKPGNILLKKDTTSITGDYLLLVTDFGLSRIQHHDAQGEIALNRTICGTPIFMAPEILLRKPYIAFGVDIWALGVTLFIMMTTKLPFDFRDRQQAVKDMVAKKWDFEQDRMKAKPSKELRTLVERMIEPDPSIRITMQQLTKDPWLIESFNRAQNKANQLKRKK